MDQFRAGFSRIASRSSAQEVGMSRVGDPQERSLPNIQILGAFQLGNAVNDKNETANNNFDFSDTVSLSRGKHTLRLGSEILRNQFSESPDLTDGSLTFLSFPDFLLGLPAGPVSAGGNGTPLSNVFLALSTATVPNIELRATAAHFFAVDDWKISQALTINVGPRLEANGQQSEVHGHITNFYPELYVPRSWILILGRRRFSTMVWRFSPSTTATYSRSPTLAPQALTFLCHEESTSPPWPVPPIPSMD
jgi:hypothetical protein